MYTLSHSDPGYLGVAFLMYRSIRPTGKMTPRLADREASWWTSSSHPGWTWRWPWRWISKYTVERERFGSGLLGTSPLSVHPQGRGRNGLCRQMPPPTVTEPCEPSFFIPSMCFSPGKKNGLAFHILYHDINFISHFHLNVTLTMTALKCLAFMPHDVKENGVSWLRSTLA